MRYIIAALLLVALPATGFSQSRADYENAMARFQNFFNHNQSDSICAMFAGKASKTANCQFSPEKLTELTTRYGRMRLFQYQIQKNEITLFKVEFLRDTHILAMELNKNNKFEKFLFKTTTTYIDSLLAR